MNRLENKVVIITGASSGVGKAAAKMMAAEGAKVALAARRAEVLDEVVAEITAAGGTAIAIPTDISNPDDVVALVAKTEEALGPLDVIVNNAGVLEAGLPSIDKFKNEDLDRILATNVYGTLYCMREASKAMLAHGKGGSIVNIASVAGLLGIGGAAYCASKGAVLGETRHAALRLNRDHIRVNAICPGSINTPMVNGAQVMPDMDLISQLMVHCDLQRQPSVCEPEQVAYLIIYLASDESAPVTGQNIIMDYGVNL